MVREQWNARWESVAGGLIVAAVAFGTSGCKSWFPEHVETPVVERRDATRGQLLAMLDEQKILMRLYAHATITIIEESEVFPATEILGAGPKALGKPDQSRVLERGVNGSFYLARNAGGHRNVRMSGEVEGATGVGFTLLGKDNDCWIVVPTTQEERDRAISRGQAAPRGKLLHGAVNPNGIRAAGRRMMRPQDFGNLLLLTEAQLVLNGNDICAIEKWPDYYVLSFLRPDAGWPNHLYSKIWIEREQLTVAIHQLFDVNGNLVAEARFGGYVNYPVAKDGKIKVEIPTVVQFLWPKDKIVMQTKFDDVKINGLADFEDAKVFNVKKFEAYPTESLDEGG